MWRRTGAPMLGIERLPSGLAVDIANRRQAWALLPRVGELANANLSGVITGRVSVLAGPAVTCGPG